MPGELDVWNLMHNPYLRSADAADAPTAPLQVVDTPPAMRSRRRNRRRGAALVVGVAALAVVGAGAAVASDAHKSVTLDIDGDVTKVSTWSGSVAGVLAEQGLTVGEHDIVAPTPEAALNEGTQVTVRIARQVTVSDGDTESTVWATGTDAGEVLDTLAARGEDVHLVASRSSERTALPVELPSDEAVNVVDAGEVIPLAAGPSNVDEALDAAGVTLGELDTVAVDVRDDDGSELEPGVVGTVSVVVTRHAVEERTKVTKIEHKTKTVEDSSRYEDLPVVVRTAGKDGKRTRTYEVTLVDGEVVDKVKTSDEVTKKPVTEVRVKGTKERPAPKAAKSSGSTSTKSQGKAPSSGVWAKLAACESGGRPNAVSASGAYHGLYQFSVATWRSVGGSGLPSQASAAEQTKRAKMLQARSGWGQWPHCSAKLGLR
ncbi:uncharacterized protein YabE (DUF348 family) [Flavimobilis soli]|uniref:Uncharacterized protein YabE (DUF348 family) n=2 Tax=Flavimobilis soli TaxID=442709 RepID=A0A2A9EGX3_9MICO|nr:uncharacterized protein YabE (DUF348 family) [Flavimobilis soli]